MTSHEGCTQLAEEIARLEAEIESALSASSVQRREPLEEIRRKLEALKERIELGR